VTSGTIEYTQETSFTPSATVVPETTTKPAMVITVTEATAKCATIASIVKVSKQSLADTGLMNAWLNVRLGYSVNLKEEDTLINGDATNSISGLMQLATPYAYTPATGDTGMDDYTAMRLLKTTVGGYIFVGTASTNADDESVLESPMKIWQIPTIISPSMAPGSFIVGAFTHSTILFSREVLTIEIAFQNEDDFIRNLVCMRGELRSGLCGAGSGGRPQGHAASGKHGGAERAPARRAAEEIKKPAREARADGV
jgi:hypothetical protein